MSKVIAINPVEVSEGKEEEALALWDRFEEVFRKQPGWLSAKLHRAVRPDARFRLVHVDEWDSPGHFQAALQNGDLQRLAVALGKRFSVIQGPGVVQTHEADSELSSEDKPAAVLWSLS